MTLLHRRKNGTLTILLVASATLLLSASRASAQARIALRSDQPKEVTLGVDGRITLDAAAFFPLDKGSFAYQPAGALKAEPFRMAAGTSVTQARLGFFSHYDKWSGRIDVNYAGQRITFCDIYAAYDFNPHTNIVLGHQIEPLSLGVSTSTRSNSLTGPLPVDFLIPYGRHWGISGTHWGEHYWLSAGLFAGGTERIQARENHQGEGYGAAMRAIWRPYNTEERTLHLGLSAAIRTPERVTSDEGVVTVGGRSGSLVENRTFIAGRLSGIDHYSICDLEAAYRDDRFFVQGEALYTTFSAASGGGSLSNGTRAQLLAKGERTSFWGAYLVGSYMLRGKQRSYSSGGAVFSNVHRTVEPGGNVELMAGASVLDAKPIIGKGYELISALNWYPNKAMMLGLSHTFTDFSEEATAQGRLHLLRDKPLSYHTLQLRAQFVF